MKKILFITTIILFSILIVKNTQATMCCRMSGGNCICNVTGNCGYICDNGWSNCNNAWGDGCECPQPANCCGGSGNNIKYYGCNICNGANCAVCGVTSCLAQDCNTTNYCSGGACTICSSGLYNDDKNSANGCENAAPQWINALTNSTTPQIRDVISFNVNWTDNTGVNTSLGLGVNFTILSLNGMGPNCDQWANVSNKSWNNVQSLWSNLTWKIPDQCAGKTVAWRQYANDSANRWNVFEQYITIAKGWLNVTLIEPNTKICNETNPCEWCAFFQKDIKAEIECKNYRCGMINATVRRNSTGMTMIPISTSSGDTPFYILETMVRPISYRNSTSGGTITYTFCGGITNPSCGFDDGYNVSTTTRMEIYVSISGYALLDYNYSLNSNSATLFATLSGDDTGFGEYVQIYNFTSNNWYTWITEPDGATTTYGVPVNTTSGLIKSDGTLILRLNTTPTAVGSFPIIDFYDTYVSYLGNNVPVGDLEVGGKRNVQWKVNVSTCDVTPSRINVLFNTPSLVQNETKNATVKGVPGANVYNVAFNNTVFYYGDALNCSGNVTDLKNTIQAVYYKIYLYGNENNPQYKGTINNCNGASWLNGKICSVVKNVEGLKGNWSCSIIAQCSCGNHTGYSPNITMKNTYPPKPSITQPANNTWFNKYQNPIQINCTNTTSDKNIEDYLNFTVLWSQNKLDWTSIPYCTKKGEICNWTVEYVNDGDAYLKCEAWDGTDYGVDSDYITTKIDRTPPTCILNVADILVSPYLLNGTYQDALSGMSNVTYRYYNGTHWKFLYTNTTYPYTFNWYVSNENPSIENKWININATCNDTIGNDITSQSYVPVDLVNEFPSIWNLIVRDINDNPLTTGQTITGVSRKITVNVSDPDPVWNINYVEGKFTWPNGTIVLKNLTHYETANYTYNWTYSIPIDMPYSELPPNYYPNASINVTAYSYGLSNSTNTSLKIQKYYELTILNFVNFSIVKPGSQVNATSEYQGWPLYANVKGNTRINLSQNASDYLIGNTDPTEKIKIENITWNTTNSSQAIFTSLNNIKQFINETDPFFNQPIYYKLSVPVAKPQGYGGVIYICGRTNEKTC